MSKDLINPEGKFMKAVAYLGLAVAVALVLLLAVFLGSVMVYVILDLWSGF